MSPNPRQRNGRACEKSAEPMGGGGDRVCEGRAAGGSVEAHPQAGGGARTLELTLPGFATMSARQSTHLLWDRHSSPLSPLSQYGLEWIHSPATLAHPLDDGPAVVLDRDLSIAERQLGKDGKAWRRLMGPYAGELGPLRAGGAASGTPWIPRTPWLMARLGLDRAFLGHRPCQPAISQGAGRRLCLPAWPPIPSWLSTHRSARHSESYWV